MVQRHPGVADVTAVGVADAVVNGNGQLAKAVVVLKPGYDDITSNQLLTYANRNEVTTFLTRQHTCVVILALDCGMLVQLYRVSTLKGCRFDFR